MQLRGLLISFGLAVALGVGWWYSNRLEKEKEGKPPSDASPKLVDLADDQFKTVEIAKAGSPAVKLERGGDGKWKIVAPEALAADQESVSGVTSTLGGFSSDKLVEEKASDLAQFGLTNPSLKVAIGSKDGKTRTVLIGDEAPASGGFYAKLDGDPRVFTIFSYNKSSIEKTANDLRDKRLLTFDPDKVTRVEVAAAKKPVVAFGKNAGGDWQIVQPGPYRADNLQVEEIVRKLKDAKMDLSTAAEETSKFPALFAAGQPVAVAKVTDAGGTQQIEIRKNKDDFYAKSSAVSGVWKAAKELGEGLDKPVDDLRNKKVFDFGFDDPTKLSIRIGDTETALAKSGDDWMRAGKRMDSTGVQSIVDKLRDLSAIKFLDKGAPTQNMTISVTAKREEKVSIGQADGRWIAQREGEPALYELDGKLVGELETAVKQLKEAAPAQPAKK